MSTGRTVRLFLVDGVPTGLTTAEIMNWTGHVLVAPRSRVAEALKRDEASRTGVYFLVGADPAQPSRNRVYIGEGDSIADRIKNHIKDSSKDFWSQACLVTSKDQNLTKAHVRYLESRLVEITKDADRASLANGNAPNPKMLPESDIADMEYFLQQMQVVLPVVGFDFLRPKPKLSEPALVVELPKPLTTGIELLLTSKKHGISARAIEVDGEVTVLQGSTAIAKGEFTTNLYGALRQSLIEQRKLEPGSDPRLLAFSSDVAFASPSAAASVIFNRNSNGRATWKLASTGQSLKNFQDAQVLGEAEVSDDEEEEE